MRPATAQWHIAPDGGECDSTPPVAEDSWGERKNARISMVSESMKVGTQLVNGIHEAATGRQRDRDGSPDAAKVAWSPAAATSPHVGRIE